MSRVFSLEIHFPVSRSKNYQSVLKNARLFFGFTENPNILRINDIDELFGRWENFSIVIFGATKWSGTNVFFCGKPVIPYQNEFFYKLLDLKHCYLSRQGCVDREGHCKSCDWGCRKLTYYSRSITRTFTHNCFYKVGHFKDSTTWVIDKEKIIKQLLVESEIRMLDVCPGFSEGNIRDAVKSLTDEIKIDDNWDVTFKTEIGATGPVNIPESIEYIMPDQILSVGPSGIGLTFSIKSEDEPVEEKGSEFNKDAIDEFLDNLLEQRNRKKGGKWEETSF